MPESLPYIFSLFGSFLAGILALGQFSLVRKSAMRYYYGGAFLTIALWSCEEGLRYFIPGLNDPLVSVMVHIVTVTAFSLTAVLIYCLKQTVFMENHVLNVRETLLFVPSILTFLISTAAAVFVRDSFARVVHIIDTALAVFSMAVYVYIIFRLIVLRSHIDDKENRLSVLRILFPLVLCIFISVLYYLLPYSHTDKYSVTVLVVTFYVVTMRYPDIFIVLRAEAAKMRYKISKLGGLDIKKIMSEIDTALTTEKIFLESDLSLNKLALRAGVSPHQLSEILNDYYGKTFFDFINHYRVGEARHILAGDPSSTALGVGMRVGFNSNSAFYRAFKKETNVSPALFRKSQGE